MSKGLTTAQTKLLRAMEQVFGIEKPFVAKDVLAASAYNVELNRFLTMIGISNTATLGQVLRAFVGAEAAGLRLVVVRQTSAGRIFAIEQVG